MLIANSYMFRHQSSILCCY